MKYAKTFLAGATMLLAAAITSLALAQNPEFGEKLNKFLDTHPDVGAKVRANPSLLFDRQFRHEHPELQTFMQNHPNQYKKLEARGIGAYDPQHNWRDAGWWHEHDPNWVNQNHPEWAANHPEWKGGDGDYDEHHEWHDRGWWHDHHPDWVDKHHPEWYKHPYEHPIAAEEHKHHVEEEHEHHKDNH